MKIKRNNKGLVRWAHGKHSTKGSDERLNGNMVRVVSGDRTRMKDRKLFVAILLNEKMVRSFKRLYFHPRYS